MINANDNLVKVVPHIGQFMLALGGVKFQGVKVLYRVKAGVANQAVEALVGGFVVDLDLLQETAQRLGYGMYTFDLLLLYLLSGQRHTNPAVLYLKAADCP